MGEVRGYAYGVEWVDFDGTPPVFDTYKEAEEYADLVGGRVVKLELRDIEGYSG